MTGDCHVLCGVFFAGLRPGLFSVEKPHRKPHFDFKLDLIVNRSIDVMITTKGKGVVMTLQSVSLTFTNKKNGIDMKYLFQ